tara:strand:+ start:347 stop:511 length:165 start_codon:yes stop_codon:yes gene_type:complete
MGSQTKGDADRARLRLLEIAFIQYQVEVGIINSMSNRAVIEAGRKINASKEGEL